MIACIYEIENKVLLPKTENRVVGLEVGEKGRQTWSGVSTFSYRRNMFWRPNVQHGDCS